MINGVVAVAEALREQKGRGMRRFHPLRPMTWPRWYWYLLMTVWCVIVSALTGWASAAWDGYTFWPAAGVAFAVTMAWNISDMARHDYKRMSSRDRR